MPDMMDRMMGGGAAVMVLLWLVVLAVVAAVVFVVYTVFAGAGQRAGRGDDDGLRILDQRYARGEIDRDEYEERRRAMRAAKS